MLVGFAGQLLAVAPMVAFVAFLANAPILRTIDGGVLVPAGRAVAVDLALLLSFGLVHSLLARDRAKALVIRKIPALLERSLYSIVAGLQIVLLLVCWKALPETVWSVELPAARIALWAIYGASWAVVVASLSAVESGHLFGLERARAAAHGHEYREPPVARRGPYRYVRHPLYSATLVALFATPDMSQGHLLLAVVFGAYILIGMRFEERDLERRFGDSYREYRTRVPALVPSLSARRRG